MKRKANECPVHIDWKYCFICQNRQKKDITDTDDALKTVANNIIEYKNLGELDLDWNAITETVDENRNRTNSSTFYESLKKNWACFHRTFGSKYNKQKLEQQVKKRNEAEWPSSSISWTRSSIEKKDFGAYFCAICNQTDLPENLHACGSFYATKREHLNVKREREQVKCEHLTKQ